MVLWMFLLKRLDVSQGSVSIYLLPFLGVLISAVTLKEKNNEKNNDWHACRRSGNLGGNDFDHGY